MVDNIDIIKPLLTFESDDDFYYLQILQRKKDNPNIGSNSRVIKNYYISSMEYLDNIYGEVKDLCDLFNARASIRLNKRSFRKIAFKTLENIANTMQNEHEYRHIRKSYDRACGLSSNQKNDKRWIIDIDEKDDTLLHRIKNKLHALDPVGGKYKATIPSKSGYHIICTPFNVKQFREQFSDIDVHKDNPTNLYIP